MRKLDNKDLNRIYQKTLNMRIAFDLDECPGVPIITEKGKSGFQFRKGALELLESLKQNHDLILWSVSKCVYVNKVLSYGLNIYFSESYSWDDIPSIWKDIRKINLDFLIDDSPHHKVEAKNHNLEQHYIIVPAYRSKKDEDEPHLWIEVILSHLNQY